MGPLDPEAFRLNASSNFAKEADDRIIYDRENGYLLYDADGTGHARNPIKFAVLDNKVYINAADFVVVEAASPVIREAGCGAASHPEQVPIIRVTVAPIGPLSAPPPTRRGGGAAPVVRSRSSAWRAAPGARPRARRRRGSTG